MLGKHLSKSMTVWVTSVLETSCLGKCVVPESDCPETSRLQNILSRQVIIICL